MVGYSFPHLASNSPRFFSASSTVAAVDPLDVGGYLGPALPGDEVQAMAHHVHDAELHARFGEYCHDGVRKPFSPSTQAIKMSCTPRFLSSVSTCSQNFAPSVGAIQMPKVSFSPVALTPMAR